MKLKNTSEKQTGHNSWLPTELGRAGITIGPETFSDNWFFAKKERSVNRVTEDLSAENVKQKSAKETAWTSLLLWPDAKLIENSTSRSKV